MDKGIIEPEIVKIGWFDVMSAHTALLEKEDLEDFQLTKAYIVGYLVGETKDAYYIAKEWWESDQFKYLHMVPKKVVDSIEFLKIKGAT